MCDLDFLSIYPAGTLEVQKGHPRLKGMWGQGAGLAAKSTEVVSGQHLTWYTSICCYFCCRATSQLAVGCFRKKKNRKKRITQSTGAENHWLPS